MSSKTRIQGWKLWTICVLSALVVLGLVFLSGHYTYEWFGEQAMGAAILAILNPGFLVNIEAGSQAMDWFGDGMIEAPSMLFHLAVVAGLILILTVIPALILFSPSASDRGDGKGWKNQPYGLLAGMTLLLAVMIFGYGSGVVNITVQQNVRETQERERSQDQLRQEMLLASQQAAALAVLPPENGGGGGSFHGFPAQGGEHRTMQAEDLGEYRELTGADFHMQVEADTLVTIYGVSELAGEDEAYENVNGQTGRLEMQALVKPGEFLVVESNN